MYIAIAILAFGVIIAIHELGHYLSAKALNVKVVEFAIGMGPKLLRKQGKETLYTLRALPFGGFCNMEDEYDENEEASPRSFLQQKRWKRFVILAAGSFANFIAAFIIIFIITTGADGFTGTTITNVVDNFPDESPNELGMLMPGDRIVAVNGERLFYNEDFNLFMRISGDRPITITIDRNGERIDLLTNSESFVSTTLSRVFDGLPDEGPSELVAGDRIVAVNGEFFYTYAEYLSLMAANVDNPITLTLDRNGELIEYERRTYIVDGVEQFRYGISFTPRVSIAFNEIQPTVSEITKYSFYQTYSFMRMIRVSIAMMISGAASIQDVAGPVGIVSVMGTIGQQAAAEHGVLEAVRTIVFFTAFIGVNVAVVNLLPIPAMDGGRILFIFITFIIEKITRKSLDPKYESYINTGAFILLIGLMVLILYNDVMRIVAS